MTKESYSELKDAVHDLTQEIRDTGDEMEKMITINLTLQSKMTELMIQITDLLKNVSEMVSLLKESAEAEEEGATDNTAMVKILEEIKNQNGDILLSLQTLDKHLTREYTRDMLNKAVGRSEY